MTADETMHGMAQEEQGRVTAAAAVVELQLLQPATFDAASWRALPHHTCVMRALVHSICLPAPEAWVADV